MSDYMRGLRARIGSELLEIPSVSVLVFDPDERVLLVRHAEDGLWTTPGGAVEPLEVPADAARREAWEETGLHVHLERVIGVYGGPAFTTTYANGDAVSFCMICFRARALAGAPRPDGVETLEVRWFARHEVDALPCPPWVAPVLADAYAGGREAAFAPPRWTPPEDGSPPGA